MMHRIFFAFIWIIGRVLLWIYRVDVKGLENLPKHSVLLCPNHSTDLDPVLIGLCLPLDYHLHFMAKAELFDNRALAWLIRTLLKRWTVNVSAPMPVENAIITSGGVKVGEIDPKTMASKKIGGLYFAGEIIDVDAYTGGYNLQIAWATGKAAGEAAADALLTQ